MNQLQDLLAEFMPGPIANDLGLDSALAACWNRLNGHNDGGMRDYKLLGRMENIEWQPMILTFTIERHGGTMQGSTRAELQHWEVNLTKYTARIVKEGHRQLTPMASRMSIKSLAAEITGLIVNGEDDERISWQDDGTVKIVLSKCVSSEGFKRTVEGRRKRLVEYVGEQLVEHGWGCVGKNKYRQQA